MQRDFDPGTVGRRVILGIIGCALQETLRPDSHHPSRGRSTVFDLEGVSIPTASIDDLIESKRTGRLQDAADIEALEEIRRLTG